MGHDADPGQRPVEARARPVASPNGLVDAGGEQQLGRDLPPALGQTDLIARHARTAPAVVAVLAHPLWVDGVRQAVRPLQLMHHPITTRVILPQVHALAIEAHPRGHDVDVVLSVRDDDIGHIAEAHAPQVRGGGGAPPLVGEPLPLGQAQRAVIDRPADVGVQHARQAELGGERTRRLPDHVRADDARGLVPQLRALLEHVVEHAPEAATDLRLLNHASPPASDASSAPTSARRSARTSR